MLKILPYQKEALTMINKFRGRALLADEMGLGKTATSIFWTVQENAFPCIIACQSGMIDVWQKELKKIMTSGHMHTIHKGEGVTLPKADKLFVLISYDVLGGWISELKRLKPACVILDESQMLNNPKTQRANAVKALCSGVPHILALSGTPFKNKEIELFFILNLLKPHIFTTREDLKRFIKLKVLNTLLTTMVMIRRLKKDYLELPKKQFKVIPLAIENRKSYKFAENDFVGWLKSVKNPKKLNKVSILAKIEKLKQLAMEGKQNALLDWVRNRLDKKGKLVLMFTHRKPLETFVAEFDGLAVRVDGTVSKGRKAKAVDRFMSDEQIRLFLANGRAAGTGLTLTAADTEVIAEFPWTPADVDQWADRIHRIGQKSKKVEIFFPVALGTIEERIAKLIDRKRRVFDGTIDNRATQMDVMIDLLIQSYIRKGE